MEWHESSLPLAWLLPRTADLADQHEERVIEFIHDALFERDNGIVRDANLFRADLGAALCDVAQADAQFLAEQPSARCAVHGVHLQTRDAHKKARPRELFLLVVLAQNVANVLAEKTFDALAELLDAVHVSLVDFPFGVRPRLEGGNPLVDAEIPGDVGDQILDERKRLHRQDGDGLVQRQGVHARLARDRKSTRLNSSHVEISYAVFCLKKKKTN